MARATLGATVPLKLLMAEDNPADAELVLRELRRAGFAPAWQRVDNAAAFQAALAEGFELVISDYDMPQFGALPALRLVQASGREIPFLVVSGTIGEETAVEAMRLGATDYLLKDRLARLGPAVEQALQQGKLRRERALTAVAMRESEERFREIAESIQDVFWCSSPDFLQVHYVSPLYASIWGRSVASLHADPLQWLQAIVAEDQTRVGVALAQLPTSNFFDVEYRIERPDRTQRWIRDRGFVVRDPAGVIARIVGVASDITERIQAGQKIQEQLAELLRWQTVMLDREERLLALKAEVNALLGGQQLPPRYDTAQLTLS